MYVSVLFVRLVVAELRRRGLPTEEALAHAGISEGVLAEVGNRVALERFQRLLALAEMMAEDPSFGLSFGQNIPGHGLHVLSCLLLSSPTLRAATEGLSRHVPYLADGVHWELREERELAYLGYREGTFLSMGARIAAEAALVVATRVLFWFTRERPREVWFRHRAPAHAEAYRAVFACPARFEQASNALVFPRELLDVPQGQGDPSALRVLHDAATRLLCRSQETIPVSTRVRMLLLEGDFSCLSADRLAQRLGMSRRHMRRKLAQEGVSLTALLDEVRYEAACEALRSRRYPIRETAQRLGYSEPSAFHRAFKRWSGMTPSQFSRVSAGEASGTRLS